MLKESARLKFLREVRKRSLMARHLHALFEVKAVMDNGVLSMCIRGINGDHYEGLIDNAVRLRIWLTCVNNKRSLSEAEVASVIASGNDEKFEQQMNVVRRELGDLKLVRSRRGRFLKTEVFEWSGDVISNLEVEPMYTVFGRAIQSVVDGMRSEVLSELEWLADAK